MSKTTEDPIRTEITVLGPDDPEQRCLGSDILAGVEKFAFAEALRQKKCRKCGTGFEDRSEKSPRRHSDGCQKG